MSTSSSIGITGKNSPYNGSVKAITCHWDGYPDWMGPILTKSYNTKEKLEELINLGNLSSIGHKINPTTNTHSFDNPEDDTVVAYCRDRSEAMDEGNMPITYASTKDYKTNQDEEFAYLFDIDKNDWFIVSRKRITRLPDKYRYKE